MARFQEQSELSREQTAIAGRTRTYTVDKIQRGRASLTPAIAKALEASTGCSSKSLLNDEDPIRTIRGGVLTPTWVGEWMHKPLSEEEILGMEEKASDQIRLLIRAAAAKSPGAMRGASVDMRNAMNDALKNWEIKGWHLEGAANGDEKALTMFQE